MHKRHKSTSAITIKVTDNDKKIIIKPDTPPDDNPSEILLNMITSKLSISKSDNDISSSKS